jgi:5-methylcytosine-specific restriction endonuclease McrA
MAYDTITLKRIFRKTQGYCHICWGRLILTNYGCQGNTGAWEVEHHRCRVKGGSDHINNLYAAHISCNRSKGTTSSKSARAANGVTRAPYSRKKIAKIKKSNATTGAVVGGLIGTIGGPVGIFIGATLGNLIGRDSSPRK